MDRRTFLSSTAAASLAACAAESKPAPAPDPVAPAPAPAPLPPVDPGLVRVASVRTAVEGQLLPALIARFEAAARYRVKLAATSGVYDLGRAGDADLAISHYGHRDAEAFVMDGLGEWPRTIFSNQMELIGPPADPAGVRGLSDAGEAFRRIAATRSPFLRNDLDGVHYLTEILWHAAGRPERAGWFLDERTSGETAIERASQLGAYSLWGLTPFLRLRNARKLGLEPLVLADPLLHRMLVSIVVKP